MDALTRIKQYISEDFDTYNACFAQALQTDNILLKQVLEHVAAKQGKQMRPIIILLSAKLCSGITRQTILAAVSMELLHTASLVHDDIVDDATMRRGQKAVNVRWDNKTAVLVGDYLLSKALALALETNNIKAISIITELGQALSSGELLQLFLAWNTNPDEDSYFKIIRQKTAMLFAAGTSIGAVSVNAEAEKCTALRKFGEALGVCFQLKDDYLDYVSDNNGLGKPAMSDVRDGKITLPLLRAMQKAPQEQANRLVQQIMSKEIEDIDAVRTFVMQYGGLEYTEEMMLKYKAEAIEALRVFPDSETKDALLQILDYVIARTY